MGESDVERYVREICFEKFGALLRKIPESTEPGVKTADFDLIEREQRIAVIEVKRTAWMPRTAEFGWADEQVNIPEAYGARDPSLTIKTRKDTGPKRVGKLIASAWKQLEGYDAPKILVFVNDEHQLDIVDLVEAWNGFLDYGTETTGYLRNVASNKIVQGHIKDTKGKIDLYVWFDRHYGKGTHIAFATGRSEVRTEGPKFSCVSLVGYDLARRYFGCPEIEIPYDLKSASVIKGVASVLGVLDV
jgi:hypothetical protein